jgi:hypothetical protein
MIRKASSDHPTALLNTVGLANGTPGQTVTIQMVALIQNWVIHKNYSVASSTKTTGWTTLTFDTALDSITLL